MALEDLGYHPGLEQTRKARGLEEFETGRVTAEHRERYVVATSGGETEAEVMGNLRFSVKSREDFPVVGDWVSLIVYDNPPAFIHSVFPRASLIARRAVGKTGEIQPIAANVDQAWILQSPDRDFSVNRLERYLTLCHASGVAPAILLTKTDTVSPERIKELTAQIRQRTGTIPFIGISSVTGEGLDALRGMIRKGNTYCMLGSSGVGKSTLLNLLAGKELMKTDGISGFSGRGRHVTSHRELIVLEGGGILIDNPGMREVGIADAGEGVSATFDMIATLGEGCRYSDCTHTSEAGCRVLEALAQGELDREAYGNYLKMEKEKAYFEATLEEKRRKEKEFGKMIKNFKKDMKQRRDHGQKP